MWHLSLCLLILGGADSEALRLGAVFKARYASVKGDHEAALKWIDTAVSFDPTDADTAFFKIEILEDYASASLGMGMQRHRALLTQLEADMARFPGDYRFPMAMGTFLVKEHLPAQLTSRYQAGTYLEEALKLLPEKDDGHLSARGDLHYYLGLWHYRREHYLKAANHFSEVVRHEPEAGWAWYYAAGAFEMSHQLRSAIRAYERYLSLAAQDPIEYERPAPYTLRLLRVVVDPNDAHVDDLATWLKSSERAAEHMKEAIPRLIGVEHYQASVRLLNALEGTTFQAGYFRYLTVAYMGAHRYEDLLIRLEAAMSRHQEPAAQRYLAALSLEPALAAEQYEKVIGLYEKYLGFDAKRLEVEQVHAVAQILAGKGDDAWQRLIKEGNPKRLQAMAQLAKDKGSLQMAQRFRLDVLMDWGDWQRALAHMNTLQKTFPELEHQSEERLVALYMKGQFSESFKGYLQLVSRQPERADFLNNYAYFLAEQNQELTQAAAMVDKALTLRPNDDAFLDTKAWILFKQGKLTEAETHLRKALSLSPNDPDKLEHLGDVLAAQGLQEKARDTWSRAMGYAGGAYLRLLDKLDPSL